MKNVARVAALLVAMATGLPPYNSVDEETTTTERGLH